MQKFLRMNCVFTTMMNISVISNLFGDSGVLSLCVWRETRRPYFVCNDNRISLILSARNRTLVQCTHIHTKESTNEHRKRGKLARNPRIASAKRPNEKTFCAVARRKKKKTPKGDWILLWVCMRMNECAIYISHRISIIFDSKLWPRYSFAFTFSFVRSYFLSLGKIGDGGWAAVLFLQTPYNSYTDTDTSMEQEPSSHSFHFSFYRAIFMDILTIYFDSIL